jgi:hypothetical protein
MPDTLDTSVVDGTQTAVPEPVYLVDKDGNPITSDNPIIVKVSNTGDFSTSTAVAAAPDSSQVVQYLDYCNSGLILCAVLLAILLGVSLMRFFFDRFRA